MIALRRIAIVLMVAFVSLSGTAAQCDGVPIDLDLPEASRIINDAMARLENDSSNWQAVLRDAIDEIDNFSGDLARIVGDDLQRTLNRTVAAAGEEARCTAEFFGSRVTLELQRLFAKIHGEEVKPTPHFCHAVPTSVDLGNPTNTIEISGYNFDAIPPVEVYARPQADPANLISLNSRLTRPSHHHLTLDISPRSDFVLDDKIDRIIFKRNELEQYDISVIPKRCEPSTTSVDSDVHLYVRPKKTAGDGDFFGKLQATITVRLEQRGEDEIFGTIEMDAEEEPGDTKANSTSDPKRVYTAPSGTRISQILVPLVETFAYSDGNEDPEPEPPDQFNGAAEIVDVYRIHGDRHGEDVTDEGGYTDADAELNMFKVDVIENVGCL